MGIVCSVWITKKQRKERSFYLLQIYRSRSEDSDDFETFLSNLGFFNSGFFQFQLLLDTITLFIIHEICNGGTITTVKGTQHETTKTIYRLHSFSCINLIFEISQTLLSIAEHTLLRLYSLLMIENEKLRRGFLWRLQENFSF